MKRFSLGLAMGSGVVVALAVGVWLTIAYTGFYNVAATDPHSDTIRWTFEKTRDRAVERQSAVVKLPEEFGAEKVAEGAEHYAESCVLCHGGPGEEAAEWSHGMRPKPPHLAEAAKEWEPEEIYWIAQNGFKLTGMPAFGESHSEEEILALTAFVTKLPGMTEKEYKQLTGTTGQSDQ